MYRKTQTNKFREPFQATYLKEQEDPNTSVTKLKTYLDIDLNKIEEILTINADVDHKKQIDDVLGGGYWKSREFWRNQKKINFRDINKIIDIGGGFASFGQITKDKNPDVDSKTKKT